ncbi:aldehyde dehydrogenase family protein [Verrucomicrobiota bacterium sgz303538]
MLQELTASLIGDTINTSASGTRELVNPATEETFHLLSDATLGDVDRAAELAHRTWEQTWRDQTPGARANLLYRLANLLEANVNALAELDSQSMGKPIAAARGEVLAGARTFRYYAGAISFPNGEVIPVGRGGFDFTIRQPLGVAACIVPWNFPFAIACWKVAPALAAGNCVLLKPAQQSPLGALALGRLALEAGFPAGVLQVLCGTGSGMGDALITHRAVRKISFTGSTAVGRHVMEVAARDFKRVSLELGGKSPNVVFADADWERAADSSPMAVFDNTGQDCCARSRVFVERSIYPDFVARFVEATKKLRIGDPGDPNTELGPLVSSERRDEVESFIDDARQHGRNLLHGGNRPGGQGYYLNPTVFADVEPDDRCWREEIFGPVACIRPFDDEDTMIREVNNSPYGLSGSLWTRDLDRALRVARKMESGVISINTHSSVHTEAPFGGWKHSGIGRDLGLTALEGFTELKNIYIAQ